METFADYILEEKNLVSKVEIVYYLAKKADIFFDKSVLLKTEIARQFIDYMKIDVDKNVVLTACLLCNCKKINNAQKLGRLKTYAMDGALYLSGLGFSKRFCKICEEVNRYSESNPRERESDILELVDNFGGMLISRPERIGLSSDEALVLLQYRNLKDVYNRFLNSFIEYVNELEGIKMQNHTEMNPFTELMKIYNEKEDLKEFIKVLAYDYVPKLDKQVAKRRKESAKSILNVESSNPNRPLFSEETTRKIMNHIESQEILNIINSDEDQ